MTLSSTTSTTTPSSQQPLPSPPFVFPNARILYQPTLVRVDAASVVTPTSSGLTLLSVFGWTLGGVFAVEWTSSPIGPYREVAVLSGLVYKDFGIGAWASHIVVTTPEAVEAGRELFGLPATLGTLEFTAGGSDGAGRADDPSGVALLAGSFLDLLKSIAVALKTVAGTAAPGTAEPSERLMRPPSPPDTPVTFTFASDDSVTVEGWDGWSETPQTPAEGGEEGFVVSLPSFSGCLSDDDSPLLRYPLSLGGARSVRLRPAATTIPSCGFLSKGVRSVLGGPCACPCIQVDGVRVVAGRPVGS